MREGVEIWRQPVPDPWWAGAVPHVRRCGDDELPPGYRDGHAFVAPVVEMPIYLEYLMDRFSAAGGSVQMRTLSSLAEVDARVVVNCVGLGARDLVDDASMEPIRGQIVRVSNPGLKRFVLDEDNPEGVTYIVPRSVDCILGGTAEEGEWNLEPDPETAAGILRRCTQAGAAPEGRRGAGTQSRTQAGSARNTSGTRGQANPAHPQLRPRGIRHHPLLGLRRRDAAARARSPRRLEASVQLRERDSRDDGLTLRQIQWSG